MEKIILDVVKNQLAPTDMKRQLNTQEEIINYFEQHYEITNREISLDGYTVKQTFSPRERLNLGSITYKTSKQLEGKEILIQTPDHGWISYWIDYAKRVSDEAMQILWAKTLAGELEHKGSTSLKTLRTLSELDQETCRLFRRFCSMCFFVIQYPGGEIIDARLSRDMDKWLYKLDYDPFDRLNEAGLINLNRSNDYCYNRWSGIEVNSSPFTVPGLTITLEEKDLPRIARIPIGFQGKYWLLNPVTKWRHASQISARIIGNRNNMTQAGLELSKVVELESMDECAKELFAYFESKGLQMTEVDSLELEIFPYNPDPATFP